MISGFLISRHLFQSLENGNFSFKEFYKRRINRIMPALYGIVIFTVLLSGLFYLPEDYNSVAQSAIEALLYKVNYYFAKKAAYFAPANSELPFMHLWSLSVEEQFYFALPVIAVLISKYGGRMKRSIFLSSLFLLLTAFTEYQISKGNTKLSFYSIATRAPELLLGSLLADWTLKKRNVLLADPLGVVALIVLIGSFIFMSGSTRLPGLMALIPCFATAVIIYSGQDRNSLVARLLSLKPMVLGGLISYSLYLYHWPVMAVFRHISPAKQFSVTAIIVILFLSISLATLSYRYIEKPFRKNQSDFAYVFKWRLLAPTAALLLGLFLITGTKGLPQRYGADSGHVAALKYLTERYCHNHFDDEKCRFGDSTKNPRTLLVGDSHGGHYQPMLDEVGKALGFSFLARTTDGCVPMIQIPDQTIDFDESKGCIEQITWSRGQIGRINTFILAGNWTSRLKNTFSSRYLMELGKSVKYLVSEGKTVIFLEQSPDCPGAMKANNIRYSPVHFLVQGLETESYSCGQDSLAANLKFTQFGEQNGAIFLSPISEYLNAHHGFPIADGVSLYKDDTHFNEVGAKIVGKWLGENSAEIKKLNPKDPNQPH